MTNLSIRAGASGEESAAPGTTAARSEVTRHTQSDRRTYDNTQVGARLKTCKGCKRKFYFTRHSRLKCMDCRSKATK